jgi:hypothetical protein
MILMGLSRAFLTAGCSPGGASVGGHEIVPSGELILPRSRTRTDPSGDHEFSPVVVGRPVTETIDVTGGTLFHRLHWLRAGKAITPATFDVGPRPYRASGKGIEPRYTLTPRSPKELPVSNVKCTDSLHGLPEVRQVRILQLTRSIIQWRCRGR